MAKRRKTPLCVSIEPELAEELTEFAQALRIVGKSKTSITEDALKSYFNEHRKTKEKIEQRVKGISL